MLTRIETRVNVDGEKFNFLCGAEYVNSVHKSFSLALILGPLCYQLTVRHCLCLMVVVINLFLLNLRFMCGEEKRKS